MSLHSVMFYFDYDPTRKGPNKYLKTYVIFRAENEKDAMKQAIRYGRVMTGGSYPLPYPIYFAELDDDDFPLTYVTEQIGVKEYESVVPESFSVSVERFAKSR